MPVNQRLTNVACVTPDGMIHRDLMIRGDCFAGFCDPADSAAPGWRVVDCKGAIAYPGMIDLLQHGMYRYLYGDAEPGALAATSEFLLSCGTTGYLPSFGCVPTPRMVEILAELSDQSAQTGGARALGIHSEGPCFALPGAHNPENLGKPGKELADIMLEAANGKLAAVTVAPELPGAEEFIRHLKAARVSIHLGHSAANPHDVPRYLSWGIDAVTHIFNVLPPSPYEGMGVHPYSLSDALLAEPDLPLGLVCDGHHTDPGFVRLLAQLPPHRVFLETDAMKYAGAEDTEFEFYPGYRVTSRKGHAVRDANGGLCGSSLTPDEAMRNFLHLGGADLVRAAHATSLVPARVLGRDTELGSISIRKMADFLLLDANDLSLRSTWVGGVQRWSASATDHARHAESPRRAG
ncbi:MAG: amidohydrolase family protein [Rhodobacteraceae bacterium]|nr:amidohydrolase family protein [Paracoccaceae bacterium]